MGLLYIVTKEFKTKDKHRMQISQCMVVLIMLNKIYQQLISINRSHNYIYFARYELILEIFNSTE